MNTWILSVILKPIFLLIFFGLVCLPIRFAIYKWLPNGKLKNELLRYRGGKHRDKFMVFEEAKDIRTSQFPASLFSAFQRGAKGIRHFFS